MSKSCETPQSRGSRMLKESGYADGGAVHPDEAQDKKLIRQMVKPRDLRRRHGGKVEGDVPDARPDKRARGGGLRAITINVGGGGGAQQAVAAHQDGVKKGLAAGAQLGAKAVMSKLQGGGAGGPPPPPGPPGAPPAPGGPPMMGGPPGGMPMHARGGRVRGRADGGGVNDDDDITVDDSGLMGSKRAMAERDGYARIPLRQVDKVKARDLAPADDVKARDADDVLARPLSENARGGEVTVREHTRRRAGGGL